MKNTLNIMITGGKDFQDYELLKESCDKFINELNSQSQKEIKLHTGSSIGAESLVEQYAFENDLVVSIYPNTWNKNKKSKRRIDETMKNMDACICFWDGKSKDVEYYIELARLLNIKIEIIRYNVNTMEKTVLEPGMAIKAKRYSMRNFPKDTILQIISVDGDNIVVGHNMEEPIAEVYLKYIIEDFEILEKELNTV